MHDNPSNDVKVYELSLIWKEAAYNFAFWESLSKTLDWDKAYREALPRVLATENIHDYYLELMRFVALLKDGHTGVLFPRTVNDSSVYASKLPIRLIYSNGSYVVSNVKQIAKNSIKRWSKVNKINGMDVEQYIEKYVYLFIWHEKLDSADHWVNEFISRGSLGSQTEFELEYDGEISNVTLTRTKGDIDWVYSGEIADAEPLDIVYKSDSHKIAMTEDKLAIITIDTMMNENLPHEFYSNFALLKEARGYIIDIRYNGGGNSTYSDAVATVFIGEGAQNQRSYHPIHIGAYKAWAKNMDFGNKTWEEVKSERGESEWMEKTYKIPKQAFYEESISNSNASNFPGLLTAPLVVLTTANTASAAEDFLVMFEHAKRATFVGTPSYGSTGNPLFIELETGGSVRICTRHNTHIDGREFINIGVEPHVHFEPSLDDLRKGYDSQMAKGLEILRNQV